MVTNPKINPLWLILCWTLLPTQRFNFRTVRRADKRNAKSAARDESLTTARVWWEIQSQQLKDKHLNWRQWVQLEEQHRIRCTSNTCRVKRGKQLHAGVIRRPLTRSNEWRRPTNNLCLQRRVVVSVKFGCDIATTAKPSWSDKTMHR